MSDTKLLLEIKENFEYATSYWREIREEGATDMRYVSGDPWPAAERKAREAAKRPCIALDELNQYTNQLINDVRLNKRAIKVVPRGNGASDETAEFRGNLIRQIEYKSNAQAAYCTAFEGGAQRSYGFARIGKRYVSPSSFDQELVIRRIPNPDTVYIDPDTREADCADMGWAFIVEQYRQSQFEKKWPKAEIKSFSAELIADNPLWLHEDSLQVAEYWRKESRERTLLLIEDGGTEPVKLYLDELPGAKLQDSSVILPGAGTAKLLNSRKVDDETVKQYITNGVEILESNDWDGRYIPIGVCFGKEVYVDEGAGSKRKLLSLIRLARDPYMLYCYYRTCEMELAGMVPKVPAIGYEGQFEGHEEEWQNAHRVPIGFLQAKPVTDNTGGAVLPLPQWNRWEPPIQALEMGAEAARRAIQSAVGMFNTSVGKHDTNAQSGVAIKALDQQSSQGSFHFIDNYDRFLEHMGRMLDDLIDKTYDAEGREVGIRKPDDEHELVRVNQPYIDPRTKQQKHYPVDQGEHDVSITTGPSYQAQRDEAADFANNLAQNEAIFPRIADLIVKLRNLGPIGDEIAKRLTPPDIAAQQAGAPEIPPQVKQQFDHAQQQVAQLHAYAQQLEGEIKKLQAEKDAKVIDNEYRVRIEQMKIEAQLAIAEVNTKAQALSERAAFIEDLWKQLHGQAHEAGITAMQQGHQADMAQQQQAAAQQTQATDQAHQAAMAQQAQEAQQQAEPKAP